MFGLFVTYDASADTFATDTTGAMEYYSMYQDIHVMIFVGFGFLMTFLRRYGFGAVGLTLFLACVAIQWDILNYGFWHRVFGDGSFVSKIRVNIVSLINADFSAAAVLISFGGVIGKVKL